ncbi:prolipoprotein diacylglyceryl transferase [Finegoldia magna]|uniref:prolipoprotein diacylglyceryl transferase n=1 Tax=Finegoldia magna TaxID=1260 RepID=UPI002804A541|nr:prolipoprotein diacylglyceryl transferase [Finegoldia magna]MDU5069731.1 prolipoprotein diacylglyceryl transferase [Finegoldia magna]
MDRVAFSIFGIDIMWYGILISLGVVLGYVVAVKLAKIENISENAILDILIWALPLAILGARVYYVIFEWDYYSQNLREIIDIRGGGLAIYGGIIAAVTTCYVICKKKNLKFLKMLDIFMPAIALGQAIGRWGNFINKEAYGTPTNLPWAITIEGVKVHPTFLYESLGDFIIFLVLVYIFKNKKKFHGQITSLYMILYGILRFFVEGLRTDSLYIGALRVSQLVSIVIVIFGIILQIKYKKGIIKSDEM